MSLVFLLMKNLLNVVKYFFLCTYILIGSYMSSKWHHSNITPCTTTLTNLIKRVAIVYNWIYVALNDKNHKEMDSYHILNISLNYFISRSVIKVQIPRFRLNFFFYQFWKFNETAFKRHHQPVLASSYVNIRMQTIWKLLFACMVGG